jgi:hypothetical protein
MGAMWAMVGVIVIHYGVSLKELGQPPADFKADIVPVDEG